VKWLISVTDFVTTERKVIEVFASHRDGVGAFNNAYAMAGDYLNIIPSVSLLGGLMQLNIQNNEVDDVMVDITRIPVTACFATSCDCTDVAIVPQNKVIPATATQTIDSVSQLGTRAVKWLVSVTDLTTLQTEMYQLFAVHNNGTTSYSLYSLLGVVQSHAVILTETSLNFTFEITNTGANTVQVDAVRLPIMV
jgi:hypothetical protein